MKSVFPRWDCLALLLAGVPACAGAPVSSTPAAPVAAVETPAPVVEEKLPPDAVRCGIDDAPVPVGRGDAHGGPDRRLALLGRPIALVAMPEPSAARAALPSVELSPRAEGVPLSRAQLAELFQPCAEQAQPSDEGEITLSVAFGSSGAPRTTRPSGPNDHADASAAGAPGPSPFARCVAERACRFPTSLSLAGQSLTARIGVILAPPVFRGEVAANVWFMPAEPPPRNQVQTKRQQARMDLLRKVIAEGGETCARRLPPADNLMLEGSIEIVDGKSRHFSVNPAVDHAEVLARCLEAVLPERIAKLDPAPKLFLRMGFAVQLVPEVGVLPVPVE